ncbi:MAG: hypothetical protein AAF431_00035 [Pseudomonadota bacterium]
MKTIHTLRVFALAVILGLTGCAEDQFTVNAEFSRAPDLAVGTPVYFEDQQVGQVGESESENPNVITLVLEQPLVSELGENAAVVINPYKTGSPLELFDRGGESETLLQNGQMIKGLGSMFELSAWLVGDALLQGTNTVSKTIEAFQNYLQSDEFEQDQEVIKEQIETAKDSAQEVFKQLEEDLNRAAEEWQSSEQDVNEATRETFKQLSEELAPVLQEMAESGSEFALQLEEFARGLEQSAPDQQQASVDMINRLIASLENLKAQVQNDQQEANSTEVEPE